MELNQYLKVIWRRKFVILLTIILAMIVVVIGTSTMTPIYQASTVLRIATSTSEQLSYTDYTYSERLINTYIVIATSRPVLSDLESRLGLTEEPVVKAEILPSTELIKITVEHTNPQIAAQAANTLANILVEQSAPQYAGGKKSPQELLVEQLIQIQSEMSQAQQAYETLQVQTLPTSQQFDIAKETLQLRQSTYASLSAEYEQIILQGDALTKANQAKKELLAKQFVQAKTDLDQAQKTYNELQAQTLANTQQVEAAKQALQLKQNIYAALNAQYTDAILRGGIQANMITVVEAADIPKLPFRPQVLLNYALGLLVGLVGGLGLAFIVENLDTTLYTLEDIETASNLPVLSNIPSATRKQLKVSQDNATSFAEAFRNLAISVQLINNRQKAGKALLIMSAEPAQGKSMIVYNLAFSLAELGEKVVVIDCDLRLPKIHSLFGLKNEIGLEDVLESKVTLNDALQETTFQDIKVLTSGANSFRPSTSLNSSQMTKIIHELKRQFDYVLLDSAALLAVADVVAIAQVVDGLIEVVRRMHARREAIQKASKFLAGFPDKFVGLIVNQAENNRNLKYYHSHRKLVVQPPMAENKVFTVEE